MEEEEQSVWIIGLVLVGVTVLVALHSIAQGGGVKLKLSSWQGYLAYFLMGIQFLWALPGYRNHQGVDLLCNALGLASKRNADPALE